jgi:hypothetical protein
MKALGNSIRSNISFYLLLVVLFLLFLTMTSCKENTISTEPQSAEYFDSSLLNYSDYIQASIPAFGLDSNPLNAQQNRAQIYWYNENPSSIKVNDISNEELESGDKNSSIEILNVVFNPAEKGVYNSGELSANLKSNWGGFARALPADVMKKIQNKNLVIKIWMKIETSPSDAVLNIDLGRISEEIIPNGRLDSEDQNGNNLLDEGEDTGIDGILDIEEPSYQTGTDPNDDNFSYSSGSFEKINGTEGNSIQTGKEKKYDTEDLNGNFAIDFSNEYLSYQIPLDKSKINDSKIYENGNSGWIQVKIPVDLPDLQIGIPDKNQTESLRFWITNAESTVHLKIAQIIFDEI